jgi:uncharacterized protein YchJ
MEANYKEKQNLKSKILIIPNNTMKNTTAAVPRINPVKNVGRNDMCTCGSGKKFKKCCGENKFIEAYKLIEQSQSEPQR